MMLTPGWLSLPQTQQLLSAFARENAPVRFVGGCVRDALLGRTVGDIDAATPLPPDAVMALLARAGIQAIPTGIAHGTVTAVIDRRGFEITTLRKDMDTDGRHARVEYTDDWKQDAARRDFTMNALYLSPEGELSDYFGGAEDAQAGRVRFIGDATARITEDYLRILRFFRFHAHYGRTAPDAEALAACSAQGAHIETLSAERIQQEMLKLLTAPHASITLALMQQCGVAAAVFGFAINSAAVARLEEIADALTMRASVEAKLMSILQNSENALPYTALVSRWKLSNACASHLRTLAALASMPNVSSFAEQKKRIRHFGGDYAIENVMLNWAAGSEPILMGRPAYDLILMMREWTPPIFGIDGEDLQALGIPEGKRLGEILRSLEEAWEQSDYKMGREELLALARMEMSS